MKRGNLNRLVAILLAGVFGLFLTYGSLTSSDFPFGLYGPPHPPYCDSLALLDGLNPSDTIFYWRI